MAPREYCVWSSTEEQALLTGVQRHGLGAWEVIRSDPTLQPILKDRTGVQLKDKWRNLVKFKHVGRVSTEVGQAQALNFRDRKRRRLHSPDQTGPRPGGRRNTPADSPASETPEDRSPTADLAQELPPTRGPGPAIPLAQHRQRFERAEQGYASALAVTMLAQAAFDALAAGLSGSTRQQQPQAQRGQNTVHSAAGPQQPEMQAPAGSSDHQQAGSPEGQTAQGSGQAAPAEKLPHGVLKPEPASTPAEEAAPVAFHAMPEKGREKVGEERSLQLSGLTAAPAGEEEAGEIQGPAMQFMLEPDDLLGSGGVATWLADSKHALRAAEQEVRTATAELDRAERTAESPPPVRRRPVSSVPASRRLSQRNVGKQRRSYRDELGSDAEDDSDDADEDLDDMADGLVPNEDRRYGIYDTRRYQAPLRGKTPSWPPPDIKEVREHRASKRPALSPTPEPVGNSAARRPSISSSLPPGRQHLHLSQSIAPKDSIALDIPDLLHTLLELNTGRPAGGWVDGEDVLAWQDHGFRSPRYPRGYWPTHLLRHTSPPPSRPVMPQTFRPAWPRQRMQEELPMRRPLSRGAEPVSPDSRPRRRSGRPARLRDMVFDDSGEDQASTGEQPEPDSDQEEPSSRRRARAPEDRRDRSGVKWGRTRPRRNQLTELTDDDSMGDMTFDKDMREGALALTLAHDNAYHADEPADLGGLSPRAAPGLHTLSQHFNLPGSDSAGPPRRQEPGRPRGVSRQPSETFLRDMFNEDSPQVQPAPPSAPSAHHHHALPPRHDNLYMPHARVGQPILPFASHPGDLLLPRHDHPGSGLLGSEHPLMDRPSSRGTSDIGLLGMLGLVQATAAQMRAGQYPRPPLMYDGHQPRPGPPPKGPLLNEGRLPYSAPPLDDVDLDLAADQHHNNLAFDPLRVDNLHDANNSARLESPHSASSNRSSDVAASDSHYVAPHALPHHPTWAHPWALGLPAGPARELVNSRQLACSTPPLLLNPGTRGPAAGGMAHSAAAGFGAELDEAAAAITSMMHHGAPHRPGIPEGYGASYANGGPVGNSAVDQEQLRDAAARAGELRQQAATPTELMDGHDPQLHFDLDQMLDVHQDAHALDARASRAGQGGSAQVPLGGSHAGIRSP